MITREKFWKISKVILAVILITSGVLVASLPLLDNTLYKTILKKSIRSSLGRELVIDGEMSISLLPKLSLTLTDISVQNADWGSTPYMLHARRVTATLASLSILVGDLDVSLTADGLDVLIEKKPESTAELAVRKSPATVRGNRKRKLRRRFRCTPEEY